MKNIPIGMKLLGGFLSLLLVVCAGLGYIAYDRSSRAVVGQVEENIVLMAKDGARLVKSEMDLHLMALQGIAGRYVIQSMDWHQQLPALKAEVQRLGYQQMAVATPDGNARLSDGSTADVSDRDYFKQAMAGKTVFSNVIIHRVLNKPIMVVAAPIKSTSGQVLGVVFAILDAAQLSEITDQIKYGQTGYSYIIDNTGTLIAHGNRQFVMDQRNFIEESRSDPNFERLAQMMRQMVRGETGFDEYNFMGSDRYFGFAPIEGTNWSIAVGAMKNDVMGPIYHLRWAVGIASLVFFGLGIGIALLVSRSITAPMARLTQYADAVAQGDLQAQSGIDQKDEIGRLNRRIQSMVNALIEKMTLADSKTEEAEQKAHECNLATEEANQAKQQAERARREGMLQAATNLEGVVERMTSASEELAAQVEQASRGAEEQKNRTAETATAMEEMNATVLEVARNASHAAEGSGKARDKAQEGSRIVDESVAAINQVENQAHTLKDDLAKLGH
jgi:methyl-accepting chemotaxis protein